MNRLISIGLSIAVAPTILLAIGKWMESSDTIRVSEGALFGMALPLGAMLIMAGLLGATFNRIRQPHPGGSQRTKRCPICNAPIARNAVECGNCGASFDTGNQPLPADNAAIYQELVDARIEPKSGWEKYLIIALIQAANAIMSFGLFALMVSFQHPDETSSRFKIAVAVFAATTIVAIIMKTTKEAVVVASLSVPLVFLFMLSV